MSTTPADLILTNAAVYTVDASGSRAEAVAVTDGTITAVGIADDIAELAGPATQTLDLDGRMVLPGFQDSHVHPPIAGVDRMRCNLEDLVELDDVYAAIRSYADAHPDVPWIQGSGWSMETFPGGTPTAAQLDTIVADRPVLLYNRDGHGAWANTKALEIGGVVAATPDPADGRIERDANGLPTGALHEGATDLVDRHSPVPDQAMVMKGILLAQEYLHSLGITAWQDAIIGEPQWGDSFDPYVSLAADGRLTARVVGALWWERDEGLEQIEGFEQLRAKAGDGRFRATSIKIMQDGILENFTAAMIDPYLGADGSPTDNRGISFVDPEPLKGYVTELDKRGFQVHFHAIGDRAIREALDAIEAARTANGPGDNRHHISHIQVINPADVPRFAQLDVVANGQPAWACMESQMATLTIPFIGPERAQQQYLFGSLLRSGARLAFGSDWSVSTPNPLIEMEVAVRRIDPDHRDHDAFLPDERISLEDAIRAFTMGSAFVNHLDDRTGSIEVGKLADLVVLDRDILAPDADPCADAKVVMTFVDGKAVYTASGS